MEINAKQFIMTFEKELKNSELINISKGKYKSLNGSKSTDWNIVYDIEGLNYDNFFIPYMKVIFMLNKDLTDFSQSSVLVSGGDDYKTCDLDIKSIFNFFKEDKFVQQYSDFVVNGLQNINKLVEEPFISLEQKRDENGVRPIDNKFNFFTLSRLDSEYNFNISTYNGITVNIDGNKKTVKNFDEVFNFLVKIIDKK